MEGKNGPRVETDFEELEKISRKALLFCSEETELEFNRVVRVYDYGEMFSGWSATVPNPKFISMPEKRKKTKDKSTGDATYHVESKIKTMIQGDVSNGAVNSSLLDSRRSANFSNYRSPNTLSYDIPTWRIIIDPGSFRYIERVHPRKQKTAAKTQAKILPNGEIVNFQMVDCGGGFKEICFFDAACAFDKHLCKVTETMPESRLSNTISGITLDVPKLQLTHWRTEDSKIKVKVVSSSAPILHAQRTTTASTSTSSSCACSSNSKTESSKSSENDKKKNVCAFCGFCKQEPSKKLIETVTPSPSICIPDASRNPINKSKEPSNFKSLERLKPLLQSISEKCNRSKSYENFDKVAKKYNMEDIKTSISDVKLPKRSKSEGKMDWLKLSNPISPVHGISMNSFQVPRPVKRNKNDSLKVKSFSFSPPGSNPDEVLKKSKKLTLQETAKLGKARSVDVVQKLTKELERKCKNDLTISKEFLPSVAGQGVRLELPIPQSLYRN